MTSPPCQKIPESGTTVRPALRPSLKIFLASTIILIGAAIAAACLRLPDDFEAVSRDEFQSPAIPVLPDRDSVAKTEVEKIPEAKRDSGVERYAQAYPPPILPIEKPVENVTVPENEIANRLPKDETPREHVSFKPVNTEFKPIHEFSRIPSLMTESVRKKTVPRPKIVSATEEIDALMPVFRFAENLKPIDKESEQKMPENPFQSNFIAETDFVTRISDKASKETDKLEPLKPLFSSPPFELKPLEPYFGEAIP